MPRTTETDVDFRVVTASEAAFIGGHELLLALEGLPTGARILLDCHRVHAVDTTGLREVIGILRRLQGKGGALALCSLRPAVRGMFELVRLDRVIQIFANSREAREGWSRPAGTGIAPRS